MSISQPREQLNQHSYILPVHKPACITSRTVVDIVSTRLGNPKIGHGGTLDPLAEGLLPLHVNEATKVVRFLHPQLKNYRFRCRFDLFSASLDLGETVEEVKNLPRLDQETVQATLQKFQGEISQLPPKYSAVKHNGKPLYDHARSENAMPSDIEPRSVYCDSIELINFNFPAMTLSVTCGKGFYVRALVRDISEELNLKGGLITSLVREGYGPFRLNDSALIDHTVDQWTEVLQPVKSVLNEIPFRTCSRDELDRVCNGAPIPRHSDNSRAAAIGPDNRVHALLEPLDQERWTPDRVLNREV
jgi:tRNA pseudouridine55 synthase